MSRPATVASSNGGYANGGYRGGYANGGYRGGYGYGGYRGGYGYGGYRGHGGRYVDPESGSEGRNYTVRAHDGARIDLTVSVVSGETASTVLGKAQVRVSLT